jgi:NIPSNAP
MRRRTLISAAAGAAAAPGLPAPSGAPAILELRYYQMRNSAEGQMQRTPEFLRNSWMPAAQRAGIRPAGFFTSVIAPNSPFLLALSSCQTLAAYETAMEKLAADKAFQKELTAYDSSPGLGYARLDTTLLRSFATMPAIETPPVDANRPARVFELRVYESNNATTLRRKIRMFDEGEIAIFRRLGLAPVFFGETIVGRNMPNLTYLLAFDDLAAREKAWRAFGADPEWQKLRAQPGLSDAEIVSNVSNAILRPLPFSPIR